MKRMGWLVLMVALGGCSSSGSSGPAPTTDGGGNEGGGGDTSILDTSGGGCTGSFSGAVSGSISCSAPLVVANNLGMTLTLSGGPVNSTAAISIRSADALAAKTYTMTELTKVNTQIIGTGDPAKRWGLHYDASDTGSPPDPKWSVTLNLSSVSPPRGSIDLTLVEETDKSTVTEHVTF